MARPVTYSIVGGPDGPFAIVAVSASGAVHQRVGLPTLAAAEESVEDLRVAMAVCGTRLVRSEAGPLEANFGRRTGTIKRPC